MTYVGHFPNTKRHIRLQMYRDEQKVRFNNFFYYRAQYYTRLNNYHHQEWINEEAEIFVAERNHDRDVDAKKHTHEVVQKSAWRYFQAVYEYFMN